MLNEFLDKNGLFGTVWKERRAGNRCSFFITPYFSSQDSQEEVLFLHLSISQNNSSQKSATPSLDQFHQCNYSMAKKVFHRV